MTKRVMFSCDAGVWDACKAASEAEGRRFSYWLEAKLRAALDDDVAVVKQWKQERTAGRVKQARAKRKGAK